MNTLGIITMNTRFLELREQAYNQCLNENTQTSTEDWVNKFAELIVEECAGLFPLEFSDEKYPRRIAKTIKKHFDMY